MAKGGVTVAFQITTEDIGRYARRSNTGEVGRIACDPGNAWLYPSFCYEWQRIAGDLEWVDVLPTAWKQAELPACMAPDGAEPCSAYLAKFGQNMAMRRRLDRIVAIIELVENRCMATDGPVLPTLREMSEAELRGIYQLAKGPTDAT